MSQSKKRLLLVGWDSADWKIIQPLVDAGQMPALRRLLNHGVSGNLTTQEPQLSPMLWQSSCSILADWRQVQRVHT